MFPPLNGEHSEVIALLGIAHEVGHGLHHTLDERTGLLGGGLCYLQDPFLTKQLAVSILGLKTLLSLVFHILPNGEIHHTGNAIIASTTIMMRSVSRLEMDFI
jgi:hypothetical protein